MSTVWRDLPDARKAQIIAESRRLMRSKEWPGWYALSIRWNIAYSTLRTQCDPEYAARRAQRAKDHGWYHSERARRSPAERLREKFPRRVYIGANDRAPPADVAARRAEIPDDTRSMAARLCGDPMPGRSALERRKGSA